MSHTFLIKIDKNLTLTHTLTWTQAVEGEEKDSEAD